MNLGGKHKCYFWKKDTIAIDFTTLSKTVCLFDQSVLSLCWLLIGKGRKGDKSLNFDGGMLCKLMPSCVYRFTPPLDISNLKITICHTALAYYAAIEFTICTIYVIKIGL